MVELISMMRSVRWKSWIYEGLIVIIQCRGVQVHGNMPQDCREAKWNFVELSHCSTIIQTSSRYKRASGTHCFYHLSKVFISLEHFYKVVTRFVWLLNDSNIVVILAPLWWHQNILFSLSVVVGWHHNIQVHGGCNIFRKYLHYSVGSILFCFACFKL